MLLHCKVIINIPANEVPCFICLQSTALQKHNVKFLTKRSPVTFSIWQRFQFLSFVRWHYSLPIVAYSSKHNMQNKTLVLKIQSNWLSHKISPELQTVQMTAPPTTKICLNVCCFCNSIQYYTKLIPHLTVATLLRLLSKVFQSTARLY